MLKIILAITVMLITGCISVSPEITIIERKPVNYIDSAFDTQVKSLMYEARMRGIILDPNEFSIMFGLYRSPNSSTIGVCTKELNGHKTMRVNMDSWNGLNNYGKEAVVFHELAHCTLDRWEHCPALTVDGRAISIMNPSLDNVLAKNNYKEHRDELVEELFNPDPRCK